MKRLYTEFLRKIIDENRNGSSSREVVDRGIVRYDDTGRRMNARFIQKRPCVVTERGITISLLEKLVEMGCREMNIVIGMHKIMIDAMKHCYDYSHNIPLNKSMTAREYGVSRVTVDAWISKLSNTGLVIVEDDGTLSLSFKLSPFNLTDAVRWHEARMLDYVAYGEVLDIVERQRWLYDRFTTVGGNIIMNDYGVSFDWGHFIMEAYFLAASVVWFGAGENKHFGIDVDRLITEARNHSIEVTAKDIRKVVEEMCNLGYVIRLKGLKTKIRNQLYMYTDKVRFLIGDTVTYEL